MDRIIKPAVLLAAGLTLVGCGGSSSGSNGGPVFQGYEKLIQGGEQVNAAGEARTSAGSVDPRSALLTFKVGREAKDDVSRINVDVDGAPVNFDLANGDTINETGNPNFMHNPSDGVISATSKDGRTSGNFAKPGGNDLEYMTFGSWMTGTGPEAGRAGAGSFGVETVATDVPAVGSANYAGESAGYYVDSEGKRHLTSSKFGASVNFRTRNVYLGTIDTVQRDFDERDNVENERLNFAGGGRLSGGRIEADVRSAGMEGAVAGRLYGPDGKEVGGTFAMRGPDGIYVGSFGAEGGELDPAALPENPAAGTPTGGREFIESLNVGSRQ